MIEQRTQLAIKVEGTEGAAETLLAAQCVLAANIKFTPNIEVNERPLSSASLSPFAAVPGKRSATIEFDMELKGGGTRGTIGQLSAPLKGCGFGETATGGVSVIYAPISTAIGSYTLAAYMDGMIHKIWGARGTVKITMEQGKPGWCHFVFTGADFSTLDGALLAPTYEATVGPYFQAATFTIQTYAAPIGKLEIDFGNQIVLRSDVNAISGHKSAVIVSRRPTLALDPEKPLVATHDFYGIWRSGALGVLAAALGATSGNIVTIGAPKVQYSKIAEASNAGLRTLGLDGLLTRSAGAGDDELTITIT